MMSTQVYPPSVPSWSNPWQGYLVVSLSCLQITVSVYPWCSRGGTWHWLQTWQTSCAKVGRQAKYNCYKQNSAQGNSGTTIYAIHYLSSMRLSCCIILPLHYASTYTTYIMSHQQRSVPSQHTQVDINYIFLFLYNVVSRFSIIVVWSCIVESCFLVRT